MFGTINPYDNSTYPSSLIIAEPSSLTEFASKVFAVVQLLLTKYSIFQTSGTLLFEFPYSGSTIGTVFVLNGPKFFVPTCVCILTTSLFVGTVSLYTTNGAASSIGY